MLCIFILLCFKYHKFIWIVCISIDISASPKQAIYESKLTTNSPKFSRDCITPNYYYETIEVNVIEDGSYTFYSEIFGLFYGYIYKEKFNPFNPFINKIQETGRSGCFDRFQFTASLQKHTVYTLVITTHVPNVVGPFSILVYGRNNITLKQYGKYILQFSKSWHKIDRHWLVL